MSCIDVGGPHRCKWAVFCPLSPLGPCVLCLGLHGDLSEVASVVTGLRCGADIRYVCVYPCVHVFVHLLTQRKWVSMGSVHELWVSSVMCVGDSLHPWILLSGCVYARDMRRCYVVCGTVIS